MTANRDYALLLLARTRLTYNQISDLTGISINKIGAWSQEHRPKEIRDENILNGTQPDIQEELIHLKHEMEKEIPKNMHQDILPIIESEVIQSEPPADSSEIEESPSGSEEDFIRRISFEYSIKTNHPIQKDILLEELGKIGAQLDKMNANDVELHITIEGV